MFVGRELELAELERLYAKGGFQMVVLYGRRRVGKTALTAEFAKDKPALVFTAKVQSDALNLADFSRSIYRFYSGPEETGSFRTWDAALAFIAQQAKDTHLVFVFDEFP
ncbi:MAG: ATP-binding protein [Coriobacteriaceae bacterium]|jgi:AAA+ ATPase superfamily predicted ATPase|nr:MAG: ATP-binding protein [Coriobacteriaceae bacterium]